MSSDTKLTIPESTGVYQTQKYSLDIIKGPPHYTESGNLSVFRVIYADYNEETC